MAGHYSYGLIDAAKQPKIAEFFLSHNLARSVGGGGYWRHEFEPYLVATHKHLHHFQSDRLHKKTSAKNARISCGLSRIY